MKRIEELLSKSHAPDNLRVFNLVKSEIERERLVCFFGAGLSLVKDYRKWGYPFIWVSNKLQSHIGDAKEAVNANYGKDNDIYKKLVKEEKILLDLNLKFAEDEDSSFYLKAGDKLQNIINDVKEILRKLGFGETEILTSFEQGCQKSFRATEILKLQLEYSPYEIPAIYFLPFLGARLLTTNVDESFEKVCIDLGEYNNWTKCIVTHDMNVNEREGYRSIFYIHGHIQNIHSLIMTQDSYNDMYHHQGCVRGARQLLRTTAETKSILFIGASLQDDETVTILNADKITNPNDDLLTGGRHFIVIAQRCNPTKEIGIKNDPQITPCDKILYDYQMYDEISTILLQLIRETKMDWPNCSWKKPENCGLYKTVPDKVSEKIDKSLSTNNTYELISISKEEATPSAVVNYLYDNHSIYKHRNGFGWNICCVFGRNFTLSGESKYSKVQVLHNYPLGDSVYIIYGIDNDFGESSLYDKHGNEIIKMIENWQKNFPEIRNEKYDGKFCPRVRVILFPLRKSRRNEEQEERDEKSTIRETLDVDKENLIIDCICTYIRDLLAQNGYNITHYQWQYLSSFGFIKLLEFLEVVRRALFLSNENERRDRLYLVVEDYLPSNIKTLQRTLNMKGDYFE